MKNGRNRRAGLTLIELIVAFTILGILVTMAVPIARGRVKREKEKQLRVTLREMRNAIDRYKQLADNNELGPQKVGSEGYPESLEVLVKGVRKAGGGDVKIRFLRKVPEDPMTKTTDWGFRSMQDDPDSQSWGGQHVFDVYSKSKETGSDGQPYSKW
jgi:general secretion pathway protein G